MHVDGDYSDFMPNNKRMRMEIIESVKEALDVRFVFTNFNQIDLGDPRMLLRAEFHLGFLCTTLLLL